MSFFFFFIFSLSFGPALVFIREKKKAQLLTGRVRPGSVLDPAGREDGEGKLEGTQQCVRG